MITAVISAIIGVGFGVASLWLEPGGEFVCQLISIIFLLGAAVGSDPQAKPGESQDMPHP